MPFTPVSAEEIAARRQAAKDRLDKVVAEFTEVVTDPEIEARLASIQVELSDGVSEPLLTKLKREFEEADVSGKDHILLRALKFFTLPKGEDKELFRLFEKRYREGHEFPLELKTAIQAWLTFLDEGGDNTKKKVVYERFLALDNRPGFVR